ncbi:MAG: hypothetical protein HY575_04500 [candidate division NC10 bacterium]|nr:hypothetical protein [candidate division NC10 bacterium]
MRCDEVQRSLIEEADVGGGRAAAAGALPAEAARHLEGCRACRAEAAALEALLRTLAADPVPEPPASYWATAREDLARRLGLRPAPAPGFPRLFAGRRWAVAGAAAALIVAGAAALLVGRTPGPTDPAGPSSDEAALLRNLEVVRDLELLEEVDLLEDYDLLRALARRDRAT